MAYLKNSFSSQTKSELLQIKPESSSEILAEMAAFVRDGGSLSINKGIKLEVSRPAYAKRIFSYVKELYGYTPVISMKHINQLGRFYKYRVLVEDSKVCEKLLMDIKYLDEQGSFSPQGTRYFLRSFKNRKCYLRAFFLVCGSCANPEKNYHLEMVFDEKPLAKSICTAMLNSGFNAKVIERKNSFVVYMKDAESIVDFLTFIGAQQTILKFYNVKILKETRNNVNRAVNCETANIQKTVDAAGRQMTSIEIIKNKKGLSYLPDELREVAEIRLANPEASLIEMLELLPDKISKSGLNHRFKKLDKIAGELEEE